MEDKEKRWFLTENDDIRWAHTFLKEEDYEGMISYLVVSMDNNFNGVGLSAKIEEIEAKRFFKTQREAQLEILIKERFNKK